MTFSETNSEPPMIRIRGARTHNLRNVDVDLPAGKLIVITGVSGSGKSSLAFDTLFAEGQRRYLESVSVQTRTLLRQLPRPDVDEITGLAPTISVDQRVSSVPARSTLAVTTEVHDFLRLLYARGGTAHCTNCQRPVQRQSVDQILQRSLDLPERTRLMILSPMVRGRRGAHREVLERIARNGFVRARIDGELVDISEAKALSPAKTHSIEAIVDRIVIKDGIAPRLRESIELACRESDGTCIVSHEADGLWTEKLYSTRFSCPDCDLSFPTPELRSFSFSSPWGACQDCSGLGLIDKDADDHWIVCPACFGTRLQPFSRAVTFLGMSLPEWTQQSVDVALGAVDKWMLQIQKPGFFEKPGFSDNELTQESRLVAERTLPDVRARLKCLQDVGIGYLTLDRPTRTLSGGEFQRARLAASLSSQLHGAHFVLDEPTAGLHPRDTHRLLKALFALRDAGGTVIVVEHDGEVMRAADWLVDLGPGAGADGGLLLFSGTPADAEKHAQSPTGDYLRGVYNVPRHSVARIHPATEWRGTLPEQRLTVLNARLHNLQNLTVEIPLHKLVCVTGVSGSGKSSLIFGTLLPILSAALADRGWASDAEVSAAGRQGDAERQGGGIPVAERQGHVSRSGQRAAEVLCDGVDGMGHVRRVLSLDQSPIGRSSRSCVATLCGLWDEVRRLFAKTREARAKGMSSKHFSFNSGEGRCPECRGTGTRSVRMSFLPDAVVPCATCRGLRFSRAVCAIRFGDRSVADVLRMRVDEATEFFQEFSRLHSVLATFCSLGLGYLTLGQPATSFSGGEAQRAKLASELAIHSPDHTMYVLDEPTNGLHPADVDRLMTHLRRLVDRGHSVIVIEHQLDAICQSEWVLDIGPDSADQGGRLVFAGTAEDLAKCDASETGKALRRAEGVNPPRQPA